ncbi:MAG: 6-bladed beta-propeller [Tannerella sp.]|nr:6-bladed beta-propeller [Tannerella sp.]
MKKGCFLMLAIIFLTYGYQGYKVVDAYMKDGIQIKETGKLSDIAGNVLSVPLEMPDTGVMRNIKRVRRDGDDLFMISENRLFHFDIHGNFINRIAGDMKNAFIVEYALNTGMNRVFVIDSQRNISKYDYDGNLLSKKRIEQFRYRLTAFAFHDGHLWISAETLVKNDDYPDSFLIVHNLYQLDDNMNEISSRTLRVAAGTTGGNRFFSNTCVSELLVDENEVYAYMPPFESDGLLEDSLYIAGQEAFPLLNKNAHDGMACIYPVRKGRRYMFSTCGSPAGNHFIFCYDKINFTAYFLSEGFKDDIFETGYISDFQPVDIYNHSYCFVKSGKDLSGKFPGRAVNDDNPVLFIVNLKA